MRRSRFAPPCRPWRMIWSWAGVLVAAAITGSIAALPTTKGLAIAWIAGVAWGIGFALIFSDAIKATTDWLEQRR